MTELTLTLPFPPSVNHYKQPGRLRKSKSGHFYTKMVNTPQTNRYYYEVWFKLRSEGVKSFHSATISMEVDVYPPDARKRDISNILKVLEDALQKGGVYDDDYQIARLLVTRKSIIEHGQVIVRIKAL